MQDVRSNSTDTEISINFIAMFWGWLLVYARWLSENMQHHFDPVDVLTSHLRSKG